MKKIIAASVAFSILITQLTAFAGVLGEVTENFSGNMGGQTQYYQNTYKSGEIFQREYFVEYKPNPEVVPIVVNGDKIYGKRTVKQAVEYMKKNNMKPLMGINGDYFSFKTGIPMGHTIIDGELVTMDSTGQNAVGFNADGTGFISWLQIESKFIKSDGSEMYLDCINKWCQPTINASYFLTDMFGDSTKTSGNCKFIIFSKVDGEMKIGSTVKLVVDDKFDYDGEIAIPDDKYVLVMTNNYGLPDKLAFMESLNKGDVVELSHTAVYDEQLWNNAEHGMGSVGGRLIEKGVVNSNFEPGTAPRTAVGIKKDGTVIFYVIDGRQPGFSTGVQTKVLAKRMEELGCVEALNLDGGGSTVISGVYPGSDEYSVFNSPSEGSLRACANFIFLQDKRIIPEKVFSDMNGHWAEEYANVLYAKGILNGEITDYGRIYRPESDITRGEFAAVISKYMGLDVSKFTESDFDDYTNIPDWQKPYVNAVSAMGIMNGRKEENKTVFDASASLTRAEAIAVLGRISKDSNVNSEIGFVDKSDIPEYAAVYVNLLASKGIINGYEDGTLRPNGKIKRGECAKIIYKFL